MTQNEGEDAANNIEMSLARLRLFLAPHDHPGTSSPAVTSKHDEMVDEGQHSDHPVICDTTQIARQEGEAEQEKAIVPEIIDTEREEEDNSEISSSQTTIPATGAVASVTPLNQFTKEYARVKYLLQCCLPEYKVHDDVQIWDMTNPSLLVQYEQCSTGLLQLDSWVAVNDIGSALPDIHSYGFTSLNANQMGMKFTTGNLQLGSSPVKNGHRQLVLCKIAVGRSLVVQNEDEAKQPLPPGYHSYYLLRADATEGLDLGYYHEYILNNTLQVLPQYLVRFGFSSIEMKTAGPCALCEKHPAAIVCQACEAEICSQCDQQVHSANKLVSRHKRHPLRAKGNRSGISTAGRGRRRSSTSSQTVGNGEANNDATTTTPETDISAQIAKQLEDGLADLHAPCRFHEGKTVEFYCPSCALPVCVHCKMVGDHSIGEKGAHRLLSISDAYEMSLRESMKCDPLIESRKSVIDNKLQLLAERQREVQQNQERVEAVIRQQCQQALDRLHEEVETKLRVLNGEMLEYQRQLEQIDWVAESLEDHRALLPAVEFLAVWNQHKLMRAEQRDFPVSLAHHGSSAEHVKPDLEVIGKLQVICGDHMTAATRNDKCHNSHEGLSMVDTHHRPSDNDVRKRLLSMKASIRAELSPSHCFGAISTNDATAPSSDTAAFISTKGQQMIQEIKSDLLMNGAMIMNSRTGTFTTHGMATAGAASPILHPPIISTLQHPLDATATLRGFSIQPTRKKSTIDSPLGANGGRQRFGSNAWATLLRQEMSIGTSGRRDPTRNLSINDQ